MLEDLFHAGCESKVGRLPTNILAGLLGRPRIPLLKTWGVLPLVAVHVSNFTTLCDGIAACDGNKVNF